MNTVDMISRDSKILSDSIKDGISSNLVSAVSTGTLQISEDQLRAVLNLVGLSADQSYQRSLPVFQNTIKKYF